MAAAEIANNVKDLHVHLDGLYKAVEGKCLPQLLTPDQLPLALKSLILVSALAEAQKLVAKDVRKMYKGDPTAAPAVKGTFLLVLHVPLLPVLSVCLVLVQISFERRAACLLRCRAACYRACRNLWSGLAKNGLNVWQQF